MEKDEEEEVEEDEEDSEEEEEEVFALMFGRGLPLSLRICKLFGKHLIHHSSQFSPRKTLWRRRHRFHERFIGREKRRET